VQYNCDIDLDVPRNQECLKLYQSFACTVGCPEYGVPAEFDNICYEDIKRLWDVCDDDSGNYDTFYDCLSDNGYFPYDYADEGEEDCHHMNAQNLIPASDQFAHDYCFFGDPERCNDIQDCVVKLNPQYGYWGDHCDCCVTFHALTGQQIWPNNTAYLSKVFAENATAPNGGIRCISPSFGGQVFITNAVFTIESFQQNGGLDCEEVMINYAYAHLGALFPFVSWCYYGNQPRCEVATYSVQYLFPGGTAPTWCDGAGDQTGWSDEDQCWYDVYQWWDN